MRGSVALYGGTFDPVHNGHLGVARALRPLFRLDEVLFIPAHVAPHKRGRQVTPALHRFAMLALATLGEMRERVSTIELDSPERPYTIETVERMRAGETRGRRTFFVMGADSWLEIETWHEWRRLLDLTDVIVVARPGFEFSRHGNEFAASREIDLRGCGTEGVADALARYADAPRVYLTDAVRIEIAATDVRRAARLSATEEAAANETIDDAESRRLERFVPACVADYITKYRLYDDEHGT